jgi:hypothetical protein
MWSQIVRVIELRSLSDLILWGVSLHPGFSRLINSKEEGADCVCNAKASMDVMLRDEGGDEE